ncbi:hypothetical protein GLOIN_2v1886406 [Rhizophagus irregularis DAOM 181602=DAOM 197198]|nr:hypothetical protein GLOIN_2v1886406 [Rhizophagus irregularis DAOM 181602=DAOM 197198]
MSSCLPAIHFLVRPGCLPVKNFWLEHEWLKSSNESILEYHKNSMPQWIAESCHRYYRHFVSFIFLALIKAI